MIQRQLFGTPATPVSLSDLTPPRRALARLMTRMGFGTIEGICLREGEPVIIASTHVVYEMKLGSDRPDAFRTHVADYELKAQVCELMSLFDRIGNGIIRQLHVRHGLPFHVKWESSLSAEDFR